MPIRSMPQKLRLAIPGFHVAISVFVGAVWCAAASAAPQGTLSTEQIDYGVVRQGKVAEVVVQIGNTGDAPLVIQKVQSSCRCMTTDLPTDLAKCAVAPGTQFPLTVKYDTAGLVGERAGALIIATNDPKKPLYAINVSITVEALVLTQPDKVLNWGMAPRGQDLEKDLILFPGNGSKDIELLEIHMAQPSVSVTAEREATKGGFRIKAKFHLAADIPLGRLTNQLTARVRVSGEEATIQLPVQGDVCGDVLVMPQSILCAPRLVYERNQPLSEEGIIVRASLPNQPIPDVLGVVAVGPVRCVVHKNVKPEWGQNVDRHIIEVRTTDNAPEGAQSAMLYVMTTSKDQPIVTIPVFFRVAPRVVAEPAQIVLEPVEGAPAQQRVVLRDATGALLTISEVKFEQDLLGVQVEQDKAADVDHPASMVVTATTVPPLERMATMIAVHTDQPGAERVLIPVLIRAPQVAAP